MYITAGLIASQNHFDKMLRNIRRKIEFHTKFYLRGDLAVFTDPTSFSAFGIRFARETTKDEDSNGLFTRRTRVP